MTKQRLLKLGLALVLIGIFAWTSLWVQSARSEARRLRAFGRLNQLRHAIHNYELAYGSIPPREFTDNAGRPTFSWVAAIQPFSVSENDVRTMLLKGDRVFYINEAGFYGDVTLRNEELVW